MDKSLTARARSMSRIVRTALSIGLIGAVAISTIGGAQTAGTAVTYTDQGAAWTPGTRSDFYGRDQGARIMPMIWMEALRRSDGQPFLADDLARYGYLANPDNDNHLPVGFTSSGPAGSQFVGMTCAACHTRQIIVDGAAYRIDGGPALSDFQAFLSDLDAAVGRVLASDVAFQPFAATVLGNSDPVQVAALQQDVGLWYLRFHTLTTRALPKDSWGVGRLDAVSMILNRLTGLDIGTTPDRIIASNIQPADAPVRYPFVWNAPKQDKTQWPGFADNGDDILGLARNVGEVYGVFGVFEPKKEWWGHDFLNNNSANFDGLTHLEDLLRKIGAPKWPWPVDQALADKGKQVFDRPIAQGGCQECHGERLGKLRVLHTTWATPVQDVGTDTREYDVLARTAQTGVLEGVHIPIFTKPLQPTDKAFNILAISVVGSIAQNYLTFGHGGSPSPAMGAAMATAPSPVIPPALKELSGAFPPEATTTPPPSRPVPHPYESRVLHGIWAAAPYLHNGSVASLAELLKPASARLTNFTIGPAFDRVNLGLVTNQPGGYPRKTTGCEDKHSGNSRCGHEFGTKLSAGDKAALLEYMKTL